METNDAHHQIVIPASIKIDQPSPAHSAGLSIARSRPAITSKNRKTAAFISAFSANSARKWSGATAASNAVGALGGSSSLPLSLLWSPTAPAWFDGFSI